MTIKKKNPCYLHNSIEESLPKKLFMVVSTFPERLLKSHSLLSAQKLGWSQLIITR